VQRREGAGGRWHGWRPGRLYDPVRVRVRYSIAAVAILLTVAVSLAGAAAAVPVSKRPLSIHASSLTQDGQQLVWTVDLEHRFAPAALEQGHRSLCLLIERAGNGSVAGQACVLPPARRGREVRIAYARITRQGPATARVISASVTRTSAHELTASFLPKAVGLAYRSLRWQVISTLAPPACQPPSRNRVGCVIEFPQRPTLARVHTPRVVGCVPSGPAFVNSIATKRKEIALTFDDGPWILTSKFLDLLEREHAVATFFEVGEYIPTYGQGGAIERRMLADGDMIGDHTWSHADVSGAGPGAASQISRAAGEIHSVTHGFTPCLFRAPGGAVSSALIAQARSMGFTTIQWSVDPRDWARPGTDAIYNTVVSNAHSGSIVLQHDGGGPREETLAALPREIATLRGRGYRFVTVTQLLGQRLIYK
jgi:peptidoglycan-N-acetylglucosamine deacetylase